MSGSLLHAGATVLCAHGGQAIAANPFPRVTVGGQPVVTLASTFLVGACPFVAPAGNGPCVTAQFVSASSHVFAAGVPILLADSRSMCAPTGTPTQVSVVQLRALGK